MSDGNDPYLIINDASAMPGVPQAVVRTTILPPAVVREGELLTANEIAARYRFHPRSVYRMVKRGTLPQPDVVVGNRLRWRAATLEAWFAQRPRPRPHSH